jgi:hypothetical protein
LLTGFENTGGLDFICKQPFIYSINILLIHVLLTSRLFNENDSTNVQYYKACYNKACYMKGLEMTSIFSDKYMYQVTIQYSPIFDANTTSEIILDSPDRLSKSLVIIWPARIIMQKTVHVINYQDFWQCPRQC